MTIASSRHMALLAVLCALFPASVPAQSEVVSVTFTGGASAITETHRDWTLFCGEYEEQPSCVASQSLTDGQSGQRVVSIELEAEQGGTLVGTLVLPFGFRLADGIRTQVDAVVIGDSQPFAACYEYGCVVELSFDAAHADLLRRGSTLRILGTVADSGENIALSIPLDGIATALSRGAALTAQ